MRNLIELVDKMSQASNYTTKIENEELVYKVLRMLRDEDLSVACASRVLTDAQAMLLILAKLPKKMN